MMDKDETYDIPAYTTIRYGTIRDATLMCARKLTAESTTRNQRRNGVLRPLRRSRKRVDGSSCTYGCSWDPRFRQDTVCCTRCRTSQAGTRSSRTFGDTSRPGSAVDSDGHSRRRRNLQVKGLLTADELNGTELTKHVDPVSLDDALLYTHVGVTCS